MAKLERLLKEVTGCLRAISGLEEAPDVPTEGVNALPALIVYVDRGASQTRTSAGEDGNEKRNCIHTMRILVSVPREDISRDIPTLMPYADSVPARLHQTFRDTKFGGIAVCLGDIRTPGNADITWELTADSWWTNTLDLKFSMTVTVEEEVL